MNLRRSRISLLGVLAVATVAFSGCSPAPAPTPTPTAAFASEEEAFAAAEETYRAYIDAFNSIDLQDPKSFEVPLSFTSGEYERAERKDLSIMHAEGYIRGGEIEIVDFAGDKLLGGREIRATTCNDVSSTTFTDRDGRSLVPADRADLVALELTFALIQAEVLLTAAEPIETGLCEAE